MMRVPSFGALAVALLALAAPLVAQQSSRHVVVHAGHLLDVKTGRLVSDQTLVIEDGRIVSAGPTADAKIPADALRIDLPNATVLPGLIDAHTHLTMDPKFGYERLAISVPRQTLTGAKNARLTLLAGFTTIRNVGAGGYSDIALRDAVNAGDVPGPRMLVSGPALSITGGHCDNNMLPAEYHATGDGVADGVAAVQHKVRENIKYGSDIDDAGIAAMKEHGTYMVPTLYLGDWMFDNAEQTHMPPSLLAKAREVIPAARKN